MDEAKSRKLLQFVKSQVSSGGKVVTAWPPVNEKNASRWKGLIDLWKSLDETLSRIDDRHQIFVTAGSTLVHLLLKQVHLKVVVSIIVLE
ncbi:hypothetical protein Y032_0008g363 [Ancylostoma ceylanicum]|uniref:Uncharacterized protein n=1 Tax=Ancylostoma ceylanicum TaxID=53326 RepID=A0A016VMC0_9BILA|nr:hypothetical protein Y032_0008g363 [Ancylostoma ceylanicum]